MGNDKKLTIRKTQSALQHTANPVEPVMKLFCPQRFMKIGMDQLIHVCMSLSSNSMDIFWMTLDDLA